ncbi:hypothetical protein DFJ73DRAFT_861149 [Zopfochytrium polystomum]|nr:hypothetical protein DFJ73DRAFT_861149 [Zopfochytrium polystomum]
MNTEVRSGDFPFCEARWGGFPEVASSTSAAVIVLLGLLGTAATLAHNRNDSLLLALYSLMTANGVASFGAHFTGRADWNRLDGFTITVPGILVAPFLVHECVSTLSRAGQSNAQDKVAEARLASLPAAAWAAVEVVLCKLLTSGLVVTLVSEASTEMPDLGTAGEVAVYVVCVVCLVLSLASRKREAERVSGTTKQGAPCDPFCKAEQIKLAYEYAMTGACLLLVAAIIWSLYEKRLCRLGRIWGSIPAHALWHVFGGYGTYLIFQTTAFALALRSNRTARILSAKPSASWAEHSFFAAACIVEVVESTENECESKAPPFTDA